MTGASPRGGLAAALMLLAALALVAAACSGGGSDGDAQGEPDAITSVSPVVVNSELAVGENRFMLGLISQANEEVIGADVSLRFLKLDGDQQELRVETQTTPVVLQKSYTHTHEDGTVETHDAGESGVYVASVRFDEAGSWGVEITATVEGATFGPVGAGFQVLEKSTSVAVGAPAPRSETLTLDDAEDVAEIDTSDPPIPEMHEVTIAEAVTSGRPSVIVFATPAFCASRICGPTKEVVDQLYEKYKEQANFVHVEPYDVPRVRAGECASLFDCRVPAVDEWGLPSEPWVFVVDGDGNVAAKFEAIVTMDELEDALQPLLAA